ncbi:hypothetical protein N7495_002272 [Penicillium taxi]|uniref:uncharacterized protein n=1 Tax=Penicillium taxi TaxID=168475 RepID=UPI0025453228|nr:uncharacterized protein N7495_002272 [Penicillium taxi]KAJ5901744.1 hypothetical protein N7495_002272 [Penicillium taxi]
MESTCLNDCDYGLPFLKTFFETNSIPYDPYPDYDSATGQAEWTGTYKRCIGPDGSLLSRDNVTTAMKGFSWNQSEFPAPIFGSYEAWSLNNTLCTDHFSRYSAYGYRDKTKDNDAAYNGSTVQWNKVSWGHLQENCLELNAERFRARLPRRKFSTLHKELDTENEITNDDEDNSLPKHHPRSAVIMRGWLGMEFTEDSLETNEFMNSRPKCGGGIQSEQEPIFQAAS